MKNLDLNSYGVQEMDAKAMEEANGGVWTKKQEVWYERCIAFLCGGMIGVGVYELGRRNG